MCRFFYAVSSFDSIVAVSMQHQSVYVVAVDDAG